jgi:UMP-CMP kinase
MLKRLLKRSETSGRTDDNTLTIAKRFKVFTLQSLPVIDHYKQQGKVATLSCENTAEKVFEETKVVMDAFFRK